MSEEPTPDESGSDCRAPVSDAATNAEPAPIEPAPIAPAIDEPATDEPATLEPVMVPASTPRRSIARDIALMAVVFVAVFILLAGLLWLAVPSAERGATRASPTTLHSAADPTPVAIDRPDVSCPSMSTDQARVVVIGGGITGCSVAYHLAEAGWTDVLLVEKAQLTAGSTCQAAGLVTAFNPSSTMIAFRRYSIELYGRLGVFEAVGSLRLASCPDQLHELERTASRARGIGLDVERHRRPTRLAGSCRRSHRMPCTAPYTSPATATSTRTARRTRSPTPRARSASGSGPGCA